MKRAVSISIGSSKRDKSVEIDLLGERVLLERIGTDGDMEKAAQLYRELDGKVDAFGVGGAGLGFLVDGKWYTMHSVQSLVRYVKRTPVVDGTGFKVAMERIAASVLEKEIGDHLSVKRVLIPSAVDRYSLGRSFWDAGYECVYGDMMFALGINVPIRTDKGLKQLARTLIPIVSRLPFHWLYPTGESQEERAPKWTKYFRWATVIAGDCHYITRYMPDNMNGKAIVTNTTTEEDRELFRQAGVKYLLTTTPVLDGRSFGTNMMEAGIVAALGRKELVSYSEPGDYFTDISQALEEQSFDPQLQVLNE
jgi:hypothetical protein